MRILQTADLSARMAASMVEIDRTVSTWPQLGGDVQLGGATVAAAVRRIRARRTVAVRSDPHRPGRRARRSQRPSDRPPASGPSTVRCRRPDRAGPGRPPWTPSCTPLRLAPSGGNSQPWAVESPPPGSISSLVRPAPPRWTSRSAAAMSPSAPRRSTPRSPPPGMRCRRRSPSSRQGPDSDVAVSIDAAAGSRSGAGGALPGDGQADHQSQYRPAPGHSPRTWWTGSIAGDHVGRRADCI